MSLMKSLAVLSALLLLIPSIASSQSYHQQIMEQLGGKVTVKEGRIVGVEFRNSSRIGPREWAIIGSLKDLTKLTVHGQAKGLNDSTVRYLTKLEKLESLSTDGAQLTDKGLSEISRMKNLKSVSFFHLSFRMKGFTGKGFQAWQDMPNLQKLTVAGMSMGDEGFEAISGITTLTDFRTWHTHRTEASNALIAKLPKLKSLRVGQRLPYEQNAPLSLSDVSIPALAAIPTLERLEIGEAELSVNALKQFSKSPSLKQLKVYNTYLKEADIAELQKALPNVKIQFDKPTDSQRKKLDAYLGRK